MIIYRVAFYTQQDSSQGFEFHSSKVEAQKALNKFRKEQGDDYDEERSCVDPIITKITKGEMLDLLNQFASHPDNG